MTMVSESRFHSGKITKLGRTSKAKFKRNYTLYRLDKRYPKHGWQQLHLILDSRHPAVKSHVSNKIFRKITKMLVIQLVMLHLGLSDFSAAREKIGKKLKHHDSHSHLFFSYTILTLKLIAFCG